MQFNPNNIGLTANWSAVSGDPYPCPDPGCGFYVNNAAANFSASMQANVYAPAHYHIEFTCSSSVLPPPPYQFSCGGFIVNGHQYAVAADGIHDGVLPPQASIDGVFSTYNNTIVINTINGGHGAGSGPNTTNPRITGGLSLSVSLTP